MKNLSVIIHSLNEEKNIEDCINSAKLLTDEVILIDMKSVDKTTTIAKKLKVTVFDFPKTNYVEPAREFGINKAQTDWVLILDADERITKELSEEIKALITNHQSLITYFKVPRKNIFGNTKWLKHGGWWPDYQIRLINKKYFIDWPKRIHSSPKIKGDLGYLRNPLIHYFHGDLSSMVKKTAVFEDIESELLYMAKKKATINIFFRKFFAELWRRLIKGLGFFDGIIGIIESIYQAFSKTITYLFLYEKQNKKNLPAGRQVGLYNPYLDTLGGGEKYILSIFEVFAKLGYEINIFWKKNLSKEIKDRFSFDFIDKVKWLPALKTLRTLQTLKILNGFDYFFYVTDGSYFFSPAKKNFVYAMVPDEKLYKLSFINRLKLSNYAFITHSEFTKKWLEKFNISSQVIMPYLDKRFLDKDASSFKKEKIILSVGRFFPHLHSKKQDEIIKTFKLLKLSDSQFKDYKLILAGGLKKEDQDYFDNLKKLAGGDTSIILKPNIKLNELYKIYELSNYFWHFSGLGVDKEKNPELVEHFGITPLEAMASGCLTFSYNAGGPSEMIADGENGFLFNSVDELIKKMTAVENNPKLKNKICQKSHIFIKKHFSYKVFKDLVFKIIFDNIRYG